MTLSPDGHLLVTGSEEPVVNISELATGNRIHSLKGSGMCVVGVAFTPDAKTLASRTVDGVMRFWHFPTGKEMFTLGPLDGVNSFLFSPNGEYLGIPEARKSAGNSGWCCGARRRSRKSLPPKRRRPAKNETDSDNIASQPYGLIRGGGVLYTNNKVGN